MSVKLLRLRNIHREKFSYSYSIHDPLLVLVYNRGRYSTSLTVPFATLNVMIHSRNMKQNTAKVPKQMGTVAFRYFKRR